MYSLLEKFYFCSKSTICPGIRLDVFAFIWRELKKAELTKLHLKLVAAKIWALNRITYERIVSKELKMCRSLAEFSLT